MSNVTHVVGVDPGLVHTGCVRLVFEPDTHLVLVETEVVLGPDAVRVRDWARPKAKTSPTIYIEDYRTRHHYAPDPEMVKAVAEMKKVTAGVLLANTGVKKVVRQELMELLGVWRFSQTTHHQDLRAAARIALFGMLKHDTTNRLIADVVRDHLDGRTWQVLV
jgi:hypothetical protein